MLICVLRLKFNRAGKKSEPARRITNRLFHPELRGDLVRRRRSGHKVKPFEDLGRFAGYFLGRYRVNARTRHDHASDPAFA